MLPRLLPRRRSRARTLTDQHVLITGAASGIGRATAELAARRGAVVHLTDLGAERLEEAAAAIRAAGGRVGHVEAVDVSDHAAVQAMARRLTAEHGAMDVVMNIAGISRWGTVRSLEHEDWRRLVEVNLMGPIHVIEELVPAMIDGGRGGSLVNVSSAAGIIGMPWHAAYSASKFGIRGVSEVLRFDLRRHGIAVSLVCPGAVDTPLTETIHISGVDKASPTFRRLQARFRHGAVSPEQAAEAILEGVRRRRYWVYTSRDIQLAHLLQRYLPPAYVALMRVMSWGANKALPAVEQARRPESLPESAA
ncbi:SDR family oxidoreductase [Nocardioides marmotae]|uniref:SDR family oxidoreductase n=1 Tax=Nocardioides marmotae TaxID=2663857 RepID=A0A6I3J5Y6_9ACTN|nr:SDR family oxidoreductase [Nocardioides marmotae]MCR6031165.1 SDR family oxidoreductase [Gordonia jinghuaiqii]MBC9731882.1 SDR family oxidoreductase [Nocardioides marmotae]MTB83002.1 SDR family oxidoreductase [Nocardioides marmotae]MTB94804.1 SDR family oxidoreductase [Nocardioides marmotae]QKE01206.1 SDR family oxidoreductase [Nocardioides marmotae]